VVSGTTMVRYTLGESEIMGIDPLAALSAPLPPLFTSTHRQIADSQNLIAPGMRDKNPSCASVLLEDALACVTR
jgi:hypothetical protein